MSRRPSVSSATFDAEGAGRAVMAPVRPPAPRRGVSGAAVYTALAHLALPVTALVSGPLLARVLGPTGRGEVVAVMAPLFVLMFVANMGLPEATTYGIARLRVSARRVVARVARLSLLYGLVAAALLWLLAPTLLRHAPAVVPLLRVAVFALPLLMLVILLRFATNGMRRFRIVGAERVMTPVLRLSAFVALAVAGSLTVTTAVAAQVLSTLLGGLFLLVVLLRARPEPPAGEPPAGEPPEPPRLTRTLAGYAARGWGGVFGNLVNWRLDQFVLVALVAPAQLGFYAVAVHFAELPATMINAVRNVLFAESAHRDSLALVARAVRAVLALTVAAAAVGVVAAPVVIRLLFGSDFAPAIPIAQVLVVASVPFAVEQILAAGLLASGHPGRRSVGQVTAAVVTVVGLVVLAPRLGAMGAAYTSLVAYTVNCLIALVMFRRLSGLPLRTLVPTPSDVTWLRARIAAAWGRRRRRRGQPPVHLAGPAAVQGRDAERAVAGADHDAGKT